MQKTPHLMPKKSQQNKLFLVGEIVETCEKNGENHARVALKSLCVDLLLNPGDKTHLGDTVVIDANITIKYAASRSDEQPD
jgi:hypothetical protein